MPAARKVAAIRGGTAERMATRPASNRSVRMLITTGRAPPPSMALPIFRFSQKCCTISTASGSMRSESVDATSGPNRRTMLTPSTSSTPAKCS